ncbi:M1 family metallopeptidase [Tissierella sp.]|uniref:M1 family metallopeptidase n=1 Tax=Tissierella sp. TaxID=41274 RepID=UPI00285B5E2E|nr:M1 family metallopeptidase [Tissierella sp.]MDR7857358.1 M1 family metallopeptidase [Tissierella sp.]
MKSKLFLILLLVIAISLTGCQKREPLNADTIVAKNLKNTEFIPKDRKLHQYKIEVELNTDDMTYTGKQYVSYANNTDMDLEEVYFHIYPNAFKSLDNAPVLFNTGENMQVSSYVPGYIDIHKVLSDDDNLEWNVEGEKETILHIRLDEPLKEGEVANLYLEYTVKLPTTKDRFGYHENGINGGNWYPIACVYDEDGWNTDPYYKLGDPFYSEVSNYEVTIITPKDIVLASSGNILSEEEDGDKTRYNIEGALLRDFAWAASKDFIVKEEIVDDTVIKLYSINDDSDLIERSLDAGVKSIKTFNKVFGKYPYDQYSIVITEFPSGMEYPSIVFISNDYSQSYLGDVLEKIIVHETAHQWWYGVVGNDEIDEAWLDEGLTTYSEVVYTSETKGSKEGKDYYNQNIKLGYEYGSSYLGENEIVNKPLSEFEGWNDYGVLVYTRGAMFFHKINEDFGKDKLYEILRTYYDKYKFQIAKTEDLIRICEEITKTSFEPLVKEYLNGNQ